MTGAMEDWGPSVEAARGGDLEAYGRVVRRFQDMAYGYAYSHEDIAGFLGVPSTTVKSRLHTARKKLKERMVETVGDSLREKALPETFASRVLANIPALNSSVPPELTNNP